MKINIIRQDELKYRRVHLIRRANAIITFGSIGLFGAAILYMTSYFVYLNFRQNELMDTSKQLQKTYLSRVNEVADYLAVKGIVAEVADIESKRFKYKEFLNGIYALLPTTAVLSTVDFGAPGVVIAGVRLLGLNDYEVLLNNIRKANVGPGFLFNSIAQKQFYRGQSGSYLVTLELRIKNGS